MPCGVFTQADLDKHGLLLDRPACELIFLAEHDHKVLHGTKKALSTKQKFARKRHPLSEATKAKLRAKCSGWKHSDEAKRRMSASSKMASPEVRAKISAAKKGKALSKEHKQKIRDGVRRYLQSPRQTNKRETNT